MQCVAVFGSVVQCGAEFSMENRISESVYCNDSCSGVKISFIFSARMQALNELLDKSWIMFFLVILVKNISLVISVVQEI